MGRYVWIVRALSPKDGGWVRTLGMHWASENDGWEAVYNFFDLMVAHGDYVTVEVVRTIAF